MRSLAIISIILVVAGGLNWLLVGLFQYDLVAAIFGGQSAALSRIVYLLVGLATLWLLLRLPRVVDAMDDPR